MTAGHDTHFNLSFPILTGKVMEAPLKILNLDLESYNVAMGNNPCIPYDVCVHAFAGKDADIVHWEQSFNCGEDDLGKSIEFEQFIRQSLTLPNHAIVVFSRSQTPNWEKKDCEPDKKKPLPVMSHEDTELLKIHHADPLKLVTEHNLKDHIQKFVAIKDLMKIYKAAGVQTFTHDQYENYKCYGPYNADWGCCAASWHPSIKGHELRADHHAYFWLLVFRDALTKLSKIENLEKTLQVVSKHIKSEHKHIPAQPIHKSPFNNGLTCYTTFLPIRDESLSLYNLVLPQASSSNNNKKQFQSEIMENFVKKEIIEKAKAQGYLDFKRTLYGNNESLPLSLKLEVIHEGIVHICEPPGTWGKLPDGFTNFYKNFASKAFLTTDITTYDNFKFDVHKSREIKIIDLNKGSQYPCAELEGKLTPGKYVLTIVPMVTDSIMISYLIIP